MPVRGGGVSWKDFKEKVSCCAFVQPSVVPNTTSLEILKPIVTELTKHRIGVPRSIAQELNSLLKDTELKVPGVSDFFFNKPFYITWKSSTPKYLLGFPAFFCSRQNKTISLRFLTVFLKLFVLHCLQGSSSIYKLFLVVLCVFFDVDLLVSNLKIWIDDQGNSQT